MSISLDKKAVIHPSTNKPALNVPVIKNTCEGEPDTITCYKKYGIPRSLIHYMVINHFHYPQEYLDTLCFYKIHHWESRHLFLKMQDGMVPLNNRNYLVIWDDCTPYTARRCEDVKLSFRIPNIELGIPAYVLIRRGSK